LPTQSPEAIAGTVNPNSHRRLGRRSAVAAKEQPAIDVDWMIRDNREALPKGTSLFDRAAGFAAEPLQTGTLSSARTPSLHVRSARGGGEFTAVNECSCPCPLWAGIGRCS